MSVMIVIVLAAFVFMLQELAVIRIRRRAAESELANLYFPHHIYGGHVGFRFSVVVGNISLSYLRSLLMTMWE